MLGKDYFFYNSIRNYIVAVSHILDDIHVQRTDSSGAIIKNIHVPLTYAGKTKLFYKLQKDEEIENKISIILPRISFILESMQRDSTRSGLYTNTIEFETEDGVQDFQYNPIPYDFRFSVSIWSKYVDDLHQMLEQIPTFFDPDFCITVNEIPALGIVKNIPVILGEIDLQTDNDFSEDDRIVTSDLDFTLKGYLYKPISNRKVIDYIKINMIDEDINKTLESIEHRWNTINDNIDTTITPSILSL